MGEVRDKRQVESSLSAKGFIIANTDHTCFIYHTKDGLKSRIKTKTSFGARPKQIAGDLLGKMARQCQLNKKQFLNLIDCPLSQEDYEKILIENNLL